MRLSSASTKITVASAPMKKFRTVVSNALTPLKSWFNKTPKAPTLKAEVDAYKNKTTALELKAGTLQGELATTKAQVTGLEAKLVDAETKITGLTSEMGKKVTIPMAGLTAVVFSVVTTGAAFLGFKLSFDNALDKAKKEASEKRKVMG